MSLSPNRRVRGRRGSGPSTPPNHNDCKDRDGGGVGAGRGSNTPNTPRSILDLNQANQAPSPSPSPHDQDLEKKNTGSSDQIANQTSVQSNASSSSAFPSRPSFVPSSDSSLCEVRTNHFSIQLRSSLHYIYHYNVSIEPKITEEKLNRNVMKKLVRAYKSDLSNVLLAYDGQKNVYTARKLEFDSEEFDSEEFDVTTRDEGGLTRTYFVTISLVAKIDLQKLRDPLQGKQDGLVQQAIQALHVVLRQTALSKFVPVKRSFHSDVPAPVKIGGCLEVWSGFYQTLRPTQTGLSLNIDISVAPFVQQLDVIEFVKELLNIDNLSKSRSLSDDEHRKVKMALEGLQVEVTHRRNVRPKYTISGITSEPTKELTFPIGSNGKMKYVAQYFHEVYNLKLEYTSLPCLQAGTGGATFLPMEVCKIIGGQRYIKRLNEKQTTNMLEMNKKGPTVREAFILEMVENNEYLKDEFAKEFGIEISESPASVQARILPSPQLNYHDICTPVRPNIGRWNMRNQKMFEGGMVKYWSCLNFGGPDICAESFCKKLALISESHGMHFSPEPITPILRPSGASPGQVERWLQTMHDKATAESEGKQLDLLIVILPNNNGSLYGEVKRICETKLGIVSQCVVAKTVQKMKPHSSRTIVLKINAKVGGINVVLKDALSLVSDRPTIIFGAGVSHPGPGEDRIPSIAAVVASLNWPNVTNYVPQFSAQANRKEIIQDLARMVREHFHSFTENNNRQKPERIIFYRHGVSECQFSQVLESELKAIQKAWNQEFIGYAVPPITFVVVQKRHHTKLFPVKNSSSVDKSGNILPGTVVESGICHPSRFDFYLCSHAGVKGTSRPAHYHVLWDDNKFTADQLQTLTNNLCYIYARCTSSVSYVSPAYYAHLAAFRARFYYEDDSSEESSVKGKTSDDSSEESSVKGKTSDDSSEESSVRGKTSEVPDGPPVKQLPGICDRLKNLPFYC